MILILAVLVDYTSLCIPPMAKLVALVKSLIRMFIYWQFFSLLKLMQRLWISCHLVQIMVSFWLYWLIPLLHGLTKPRLGLLLRAPVSGCKRSIIMVIPINLLFILIALACSVTAANRAWTCDCTNTTIKRSSFPDGFLFGAGVSAYQTQGAYETGGKGPSIFDNFEALYPERMADDSSGKVAIDGYHRYVADVQLVKNLRLDVYRFSLSWSRILPRGQLSKGVNQLGIDYYNALIDELVTNGIKLVVTLFHWDLPQALEDLYGGFLSPRIADDFRNYADVCFKYFGDRVKYWVTFNEPWSFSKEGYADGLLAPARCTYWYDSDCTGGDSGTEPYLVAHNLLIAHASAVRLYRQKYQSTQNGSIGITNVAEWYLPSTIGSARDEEAVRVQLDFKFGWFMHPITYGTYPEVMQQRVGNRLPRFTREQSKWLIGSFDFLGLNYYTGNFATFYDKSYVPEYPSYSTDSGVKTTGSDSDGTDIGIAAGSAWFRRYAAGLKELLFYIKTNYKNPPMLITENGICTMGDTKEDSINDIYRVKYLEEHLCCLLHAIEDDKVNVFGYIVWAMFDTLEWTQGYIPRFGLYYVEYDDLSLKRIPKSSSYWLKSVLSTCDTSSPSIQELPWVATSQCDP